MFTLYKTASIPLCLISNDLTLKPLKGTTALPRGIETLLNQVVREVNPQAGKLRCVDLAKNEVITLQELVNESMKNKPINFDNPDILKRIALYRHCGLSEKLIADELNVSTKNLQRKYPRKCSVGTTSHGRTLERHSSV